jgi:hypothetical protein
MEETQRLRDELNQYHVKMSQIQASIDPLSPLIENWQYEHRHSTLQSIDQAQTFVWAACL